MNIKERKIMSNLYVPIDYSNVSEAVPAGDDILYSTLCKVFKVVGLQAVRVKMHAVITQSGIALRRMKKMKKGTPIFIKWSKIKNVRLTPYGRVLMKWGLSGYARIRLKLLRVPEYESRQSFSDRKAKFLMFCREVWLKKVPKD